MPECLARSHLKAILDPVRGSGCRRTTHGRRPGPLLSYNGQSLVGRPGGVGWADWAVPMTVPFPWLQSWHRCGSGQGQRLAINPCLFHVPGKLMPLPDLDFLQFSSCTAPASQGDFSPCPMDTHTPLSCTISPPHTALPTRRISPCLVFKAILKGV